ncbi:unnamed protein product [Caretta caretta]
MAEEAAAAERRGEREPALSSALQSPRCPALPGGRSITSLGASPASAGSPARRQEAAGRGGRQPPASSGLTVPLFSSQPSSLRPAGGEARKCPDGAAGAQRGGAEPPAGGCAEPPAEEGALLPRGQMVL